MSRDFTKSSQRIGNRPPNSSRLLLVVPFQSPPGFRRSDNRASCLGDRRVAMNKLGILAGCLAAVTASAVPGALATDPASTYYRTLDKPSRQPPPPVYGIVWTPLYVDIALSAGHAISQLGEQNRVEERRGLIVAL